LEEMIEAQGPRSTLFPMVMGARPVEAHTEQRWLMKEWSPIWIISGYLKKDSGKNLCTLSQVLELCFTQVSCRL